MGVNLRGDTGERRKENVFLSPHTPSRHGEVDKVILRKNKTDCFAVAAGDPSSVRAKAINNRKTTSIPGLNRGGPFHTEFRASNFILMFVKVLVI